MKKGILILVLGLLLSSCQSKVIRYTSADVSDYNLQTTKSSKAKMISVKKVNRNLLIADYSGRQLIIIQWILLRFMKQMY